MRILFLIFYLSICSYSNGQTGDTLNRIDSNGYKIGLWKKKNTNDSLLEEGNYKNDKKIGIWSSYYQNGRLKSRVSYVNGRPYGNYEMYNEDGKIQQRGVLKNSSFAGEIFEYDSTGCLRYWQYNRVDTVTEVKQFEKCGCLSYELELNKQSGIAFQKKYINCQLIESLPYKDNAKNDLVFSQTDTLNFKSGFHVLTNNNNQIFKKGVFKNYKLVDGEIYYYDVDGIVKKVQFYKKGVLVKTKEID